MKRKFLLAVVILLCILFTGAYTMGFIFVKNPEQSPVKTTTVIERTGDDMLNIQLIRHATVLLSTSDLKLLVDPFLAEQGSLPPFALSTPRVKNPLVPLPVNAADLLDVDAVLITHYHVDHFDAVAKSMIPKDTLIFCQPADEAALKKDGFQNIVAITTPVDWQGITLSRYDAHHGLGYLEKMMGASSSFVVKSPRGSVFFTGDAVYDNLLERSLNETKPDIVIANGGSARFLFGQPITMGARDIEKIATLLPESSIVVDHMDAVNHCHESRVDLMKYVSEMEFADRVYIPQDGDVLTYQSGFLR